MLVVKLVAHLVGLSAFGMDHVGKWPAGPIRQRNCGVLDA